MRHNNSSQDYNFTPSKQNGSMLLIVVFMMVVLALLVTALGSFLADSSQKTTVEVRATRALMAAQSGLEFAFYKVSNKEGVDAVCESLNEFKIPLDDIQGFAQQCIVLVTCAPVTDTLVAYSIKSEGRCGSPLTTAHYKDDTSTDFAVSRILTAEAQ